MRFWDNSLSCDYWLTPYYGKWFFVLGGLALLILVVWSLYWKGRALWKAAQRNEMWWFVILLIVNTVGILEILYIYYFSKDKNK